MRVPARLASMCMWGRGTLCSTGTQGARATTAEVTHTQVSSEIMSVMLITCARQNFSVAGLSTVSRLPVQLFVVADCKGAGKGLSRFAYWDMLLAQLERGCLQACLQDRAGT